MRDRTQMLANRLQKNLARLRAWRQREDVTCFRAYDRDIPEVPLAIDVFDDEAGQRHAQIVAFAPRHGGGAGFSRALEEWRLAAAGALRMDPEQAFVQVREPTRGGTVEADDADASLSTFVVREGPARFLLKIGARRDPGLFLDHRTTRRLVAEEARGRTLLNLFSYTGSFSVQAALAGAEATTSVDLSASTTRWAGENFALNGIDPKRHRVVCDDVFAFLARDSAHGPAARRQEHLFDVIVLDPPSVSRSRRATRDLDVQRDHPALIDACLARLRPGGSLWFSTNLRTFRLIPPRATHVVVEDVGVRTQPFDFRAPPHRCFRITHRG